MQITSSTKEATTLSGTVRIGGVSASYTVTTRIMDADPNAFSFTAITGADLGAYYTSNLVTLTGIEV